MSGGRALGAFLSTTVAVAAGLQAVHTRRNWGATSEEASAVLPGDDLVPEPAEQTTLAVAIAAPAEDVWRWLVQIGQDRGGMYSYDRLEDLIGLRIHSAQEVREEWQHLAAGDRVVVVPEGYRPMPPGTRSTSRWWTLHTRWSSGRHPRSTPGTGSGPSTSVRRARGAAGCCPGRGRRWRPRAGCGSRRASVSRSRS
jgi:hypothetical protein